MHKGSNTSAIVLFFSLLLLVPMILAGTLMNSLHYDYDSGRQWEKKNQQPNIHIIIFLNGCQTGYMQSNLTCNSNDDYFPLLSLRKKTTEKQTNKETNKNMVDMTACMQIALVRCCLTFQTMQRPSLPKILTHFNRFSPVWWCWLFLRVRGYSEGLTNHCRPMLLFFSSGSQFTRTNVTLLGQESVHSGSAG